MTAVDNITSLRQCREAIVKQHAEAENRRDIEATIATFHRPRYEVNGKPSDGETAVRELLQGFMPAPSVIWESGDWRLTMQGEATRSGAACSIFRILALASGLLEQSGRR